MKPNPDIIWIIVQFADLILKKLTVALFSVKGNRRMPLPVWTPMKEKRVNGSRLPRDTHFPVWGFRGVLINSNTPLRIKSTCSILGQKKSTTKFNGTTKLGWKLIFLRTFQILWYSRHVSWKKNVSITSGQTFRPPPPLFAFRQPWIRPWRSYMYYLWFCWGRW